MFLLITVIFIKVAVSNKVDMVSIYLHFFKFLNKCLFVLCGAYYIEIYHSVKYFLDKLFDILDKFYKLLIFNGLFFIIY